MANLANILIKDVELSIRTTNCLWNWRMDPKMTLADVDVIGDDILLRIPNFGRKSLKEIREVITNARKWAEPRRPPILAISNLLNNQRQLDADGTEVGVRRQALDELLAWVTS
jgi:hypothetical protein